MSGDINNRGYRKNRLKDIIAKLHEGQTVDQVKAEFAAVFGQVSADEISAAEQALILEGMPVSEVQRLCDVHASVFRGSIEEIHAPKPASARYGHPANTLKETNEALGSLIAKIRFLLPKGVTEALRQEAAKLPGIDAHYKVKENLFFPYMEKYGVTAPPKVMWGVDDEIRSEVREALLALSRGETEKLSAVLTRLEDMAFKEDNILLPILLERLTEDEWRQIALDTPEFGYFLIPAPPPFVGTGEQPASQPLASGKIILPTGAFTAEELAAVFNTLPMDVTFVDKEGKVRFFSHGEDRAFPRTVSVLGREVTNCHPPASLHVVEKIVEDLQSGRKDHEDFWIARGEALIHIRYLAVRGQGGEYLGVLETTQNIAPLKEITGEKRLMSES